MTLKTWCEACQQYHSPHTFYDGTVMPMSEYFADVPEVNPLAYVVKEECTQCHRQVKETVSGICLDCDYVNRVTASKPA